MKKLHIVSVLVGMAAFNTALAGSFVEGVPTIVQKSDYSSMHLIYIQMDKPVTYSGVQCDNNAGVVIRDDNESAKAALSFAMTALVSGLTFRCYINANQCSGINASAATFPVCDYYPSLVK